MQSAVFLVLAILGFVDGGMVQLAEDAIPCNRADELTWMGNLYDAAGFADFTFYIGSSIAGILSWLPSSVARHTKGKYSDLCPICVERVVHCGIKFCKSRCIMGTATEDCHRCGLENRCKQLFQECTGSMFPPMPPIEAKFVHDFSRDKTAVLAHFGAGLYEGKMSMVTLPALPPGVEPRRLDDPDYVAITLVGEDRIRAAKAAREKFLREKGLKSEFVGGLKLTTRSEDSDSEGVTTGEVTPMETKSAGPGSPLNGPGSSIGGVRLFRRIVSAPLTDGRKPGDEAAAGDETKASELGDEDWLDVGVENEADSQKITISSLFETRPEPAEYSLDLSSLNLRTVNCEYFKNSAAVMSSEEGDPVGYGPSSSETVVLPTVSGKKEKEISSHQPDTAASAKTDLSLAQRKRAFTTGSDDKRSKLLKPVGPPEAVTVNMGQIPPIEGLPENLKNAAGPLIATTRQFCKLSTELEAAEIEESRKVISFMESPTTLLARAKYMAAREALMRAFEYALNCFRSGGAYFDLRAGAAFFIWMSLAFYGIMNMVWRTRSM